MDTDEFKLEIQNKIASIVSELTGFYPNAPQVVDMEVSSGSSPASAFNGMEPPPPAPPQLVQIPVPPPIPMPNYIPLPRMIIRIIFSGFNKKYFSWSCPQLSISAIILYNCFLLNELFDLYWTNFCNLFYFQKGVLLEPKDW